jgi:hypothetical protein
VAPVAAPPWARSGSLEPQAVRSSRLVKAAVIASVRIKFIRIADAHQLAAKRRFEGTANAAIPMM